MSRHPLTTLNADALEGWASCARHHLAQMDAGTTSSIVMTLMRQSAEIAEGLLENAGKGEQEWLAPPSPGEVAAVDTRFEPPARHFIRTLEVRQEGLADAVAETLLPKAAPRDPAPILTGRSANGFRGEVFTEQRVLLLRRLYPTHMRTDDLWVRLNALPGKPIASVGSMFAKAKVLGIRRIGLPIPAEFLPDGIPPPVPHAADIPDRYGGGPTHRDADPTADTKLTTEDVHEAHERLRDGRAKGARDIMEWFGCPQEQAQRVVDEFRAAQKPSAA